MTWAGSSPAAPASGLLVFTLGLTDMQLLFDSVVPRVSQSGHLAGLGCGLVVGAARFATHNKRGKAA